MRQVEGEEEAKGAVGGAGGSMFSNEGCRHYRELAFIHVMGTHWRRWVQVPQPAAPVPRCDLPYVGFPYSRPVDEWDPDGLRRFCSEDCRIQHEVDLLFERFGF